MTAYDAQQLRRVSIPFDIKTAYARISGARWKHSPFTTGLNPTRFSDPDGKYCVLCLAASVRSAFAGSVIRQHPVETPGWRLSRNMLNSRVVFEYRNHTTLRLLDLRGDRPMQAALNLEVVRSSSHRYGQALTRFVLGNMADVEDIRYPSWHTAEDCIALYEHGVRRLRLRRTTYLHQHREVFDIIDRYNLELHGRFSDPLPAE